MIVVFLGDGTQKEFKTPYNALRFMYMMRSKGYWIFGWQCEDPSDNEWLNRRFKQ